MQAGQPNVALRLDQEDLQILIRLSEQEKSSRSEIIRRALRKVAREAGLLPPEKARSAVSAKIIPINLSTVLTQEEFSHEVAEASIRELVDLLMSKAHYFGCVRAILDEARKPNPRVKVTIHGELMNWVISQEDSNGAVEVAYATDNPRILFKRVIDRSGVQENPEPSYFRKVTDSDTWEATDATGLPLWINDYF